MLLCAAVFLTGFSWGLGGDPCKNALEMTETVESLPDEAQVRQAEAKIISLCPDGGAAHFVLAQQLERVGNIDGAINEYRKALQQERSFPLANGNLGML
jgi:Flp pilus assembly protein TadD